MILNLGGFKFDWHLTNGMSIESEFGISSNERIQNAPGYFRANLGKTKVSLECKTLPFRKHGNNALTPLYALANAGASYPLVSGTGKYLGRYVIMKINDIRSVFTPSGGFLAQSFNLEMERTDAI